MNGRAIAFCVLGTSIFAFSGSARARPTPIDTDHDAAGALHAGMVVQRNAYHFAAALAFPAEALALELLGLLPPPAPDAAAPAPVETSCPLGGRYSAQWRQLGDAGGCAFELRVTYDHCRNGSNDLFTEDDGPVAIAVHLSPGSNIRVLSVRYGSDATRAIPRRDFAQNVFRRATEGVVLEVERTAHYAVRGTFMQHIGDVGQFEGDFAYEIHGWRNETSLFGASSTGFNANELLVRGSQRRRPGPDGALASGDDTFDISLLFRAGTLTRLHHGPDGDNVLPFTFENLTITSSERIALGGKTITLDGMVAVAYPAIEEQRCVSGAFLFTTREPLLDQPPPGFVSPWIVRGGLQINQNVRVSFSGNESLESLIDVSLNRRAPVRFAGWPFLQSALPCFVES